MPLHLLKPMLLPLALLIAANLVAFAWRAIPPSENTGTSDSNWQSLQSTSVKPDVRELLLLGGHWGEPEQSSNEKNNQTLEKDTPEATVAALSLHIQRQLQGIVYRAGWVLLFANPGAEAVANTDQPEEQSDNPRPASLPLELRSGDQLPDTPWRIGDIWPDRIELLQSEHEPLIVPLYPLAEPRPEL